MNKAKSILLVALATFAIVLWSCSPQVSSQVQPQSNDSFNFKGQLERSIPVMRGPHIVMLQPK